jgi:ADP-ribose diphosphatase
MKKILPPNAILVPDNAEKVFEGVIYDVYQWPQEMFDGSKKTFEMLKRQDGVGALCIVDDKILILEDEQPHKGMWLSYPAGRTELSDTDLLSAAQREVREETGYEFRNWRLISVTQPYSKMEWFIHLYLAWDVVGQSAQELDSGEKIVVKKLPFAEAKELSLENKGYLGEIKHIFEKTSSIKDLFNWPEFKGEEVDR